MEKKGFIIRQVDEADRRNNRIYRTEKTEALWDQMIECAIKIRKISVKDISEKHVAIMRESLEKISENLNTHFNIGCDTTGGTSISVDTPIYLSDKNLKKVKFIDGVKSQ